MQRQVPRFVRLSESLAFLDADDIWLPDRLRRVNGSRSWCPLQTCWRRRCRSMTGMGRRVLTRLDPFPVRGSEPTASDSR